MPDARYLSPAEVADSLGVSLRTVEHWITSGELSAVNVSRNRQSRKQRVRVSADALEVFLATRQIGNQPPAPRRRRKKLTIKQYV